MNGKGSQRKQECRISPSIVACLCSNDSLFLLARHPGNRRRPRGHLVESTNKDSLSVKPTVELATEVVCTADDTVVIRRPQPDLHQIVKFSLSGSILLVSST